MNLLTDLMNALTVIRMELAALLIDLGLAVAPDVPAMERGAGLIRDGLHAIVDDLGARHRG